MTENSQPRKRRFRTLLAAGVALLIGLFVGIEIGRSLNRPHWKILAREGEDKIPVFVAEPCRPGVDCPTGPILEFNLQQILAEMMDEAWQKCQAATKAAEDCGCKGDSLRDDCAMLCEAASNSCQLLFDLSQLK